LIIASRIKRRRWKTTTAVNVSAALALIGRRVLLIDPILKLTAQVLRSSTEQVEKSLYDILMNPELSLKEAIVHFDRARWMSPYRAFRWRSSSRRSSGKFDGHFG